MLSSRTLLKAVLLFGFAVGYVGAAELPASSPATNSRPHDAAFFLHLLDGHPKAADLLGKLQSLTVADIVQLRQLAATASDPEVKQSLLARLEDLEEDLALHPEPISIDLKDASFSDTIEALHQATGIPLTIWPPRMRRAELFTVSAHHEPFWKIFAELSAEHPLAFQPNPQGQVQMSAPGMNRGVWLPSGFAIFPMSILRTNSIDAQHGSGGVGRLQFQYLIAADPRMHVLRVYVPVFTSVRDDAGHDLLAAPSPRVSWSDGNGASVSTEILDLRSPPDIGKTITSAVGEGKFLIRLAEDRVDVDPDKSMNTPITIGSHTVTVTAFKVVNENFVQFQVACSDGAASAEDALSMSFVDADDHVFWSTRIRGASIGSAAGRFMPPVKIRFSCAKKTALLTVPFTLRDLPLP